MTRTCDLRFRKPSLYPAELRDRRPAHSARGLRSCIPEQPRNRQPRMRRSQADCPGKKHRSASAQLIKRQRQARASKPCRLPAKPSAPRISWIGMMQFFQVGQAILGQLPRILSGGRQSLNIPAYLFTRGFEKFRIQFARKNLQNMVDNLGHDTHPALQ
jgi:hypothetical protein